MLFALRPEPQFLEVKSFYLGKGPVIRPLSAVGPFRVVWGPIRVAILPLIEAWFF